MGPKTIEISIKISGPFNEIKEFGKSVSFDSDCHSEKEKKDIIKNFLYKTVHFFFETKCDQIFNFIEGKSSEI